MVEGYLMNARGFFSKWGKEGMNYQIYVPKDRIILGYFVNKEEPEISQNSGLFCESLNFEEISIFNEKIHKKKFVRQVDVDERSLEKLVILEKNFEKLREQFNKHFLMIRDKLND
ncbi:hypothetical protein KAI04_00970 [Candidatus Pacearchaeota archaeon]|nr:hypothetical protein [Candidatus Pacearchaeota archaeon]